MPEDNQFLLELFNIAERVIEEQPEKIGLMGIFVLTVLYTIWNGFDHLIFFPTLFPVVICIIGGWVLKWMFNS